MGLKPHISILKACGFLTLTLHIHAFVRLPQFSRMLLCSLHPHPPILNGTSYQIGYKRKPPFNRSHYRRRRRHPEQTVHREYQTDINSKSSLLFWNANNLHFDIWFSKIVSVEISQSQSEIVRKLFIFGMLGALLCTQPTAAAVAAAHIFTMQQRKLSHLIIEIELAVRFIWWNSILLTTISTLSMRWVFHTLMCCIYLRTIHICVVQFFSLSIFCFGWSCGYVLNFIIRILYNK